MKGPFKNMTFLCLRSQIGFVPQDVFLFSDSIRNNIAFGNPEMNEEKIMQAAMDADLLDNIVDLPNGFDTQVGERGITLSGGQSSVYLLLEQSLESQKYLF